MDGFFVYKCCKLFPHGCESLSGDFCKNCLLHWIKTKLMTSNALETLCQFQFLLLCLRTQAGWQKSRQDLRTPSVCPTTAIQHFTVSYPSYKTQCIWSEKVSSFHWSYTVMLHSPLVEIVQPHEKEQIHLSSTKEKHLSSCSAVACPVTI